MMPEWYRRAGYVVSESRSVHSIGLGASAPCTPHAPLIHIYESWGIHVSPTSCTSLASRHDLSPEMRSDCPAPRSPTSCLLPDILTSPCPLPLEPHGPRGGACHPSLCIFSPASPLCRCLVPVEPVVDSILGPCAQIFVNPRGTPCCMPTTFSLSCP